MALGIGWVNNSCEYISGCDWIVDNVDFSEAFFSSMDSCQQTCMVLNNDEDPLFPSLIISIIIIQTHLILLLQ